ncbi:hypothetical protein AAHE18_03G327900 [Arachis hypogaea]
MDATTTVVRSPCKASILIGRPSILAPNGCSFARFDSNFRFSSSAKLCTSVAIPKQGQRRVCVGNRRGLVVRAASSPESSESDKQLEQLQTDRDADDQKEAPAASGTDLVLYRRIAEVKANERRKVLEEILYALVVQKFMDANISLIPSITPDPSGRVDSWPSENGRLEQLHSVEAYEMIQNHLSLILGNRVGDSMTVAEISKLRVGQLYAASVMYGYFLRRVDQRFQLEKTVKFLPSAAEDNNVDQIVMGDTRHAGGEDTPQVMSHPEVSAWPGGDVSPGGFGYGIKPTRLRSYVMSFDNDTLQRYAAIRSKEVVSIIEKHTEALFGRPEIVITPDGAIDSSKDENIKISFGGLKRLVLEAVTFGSFLWDVESYVDSRYHFVLN